MNNVIDIQKLVPAWMAVQSAAPVSHIETEEDYDRAVATLNTLLDAVRDDTVHPLYSLVGVIGDLIEAYESQHADEITGDKNPNIRPSPLA